MGYFVPKPLVFEAHKHDGSKQQAEELAKWINKLDRFRQAEARTNSFDLNEADTYHVAYAEDSGDEFVMENVWVVWMGNGSFTLYDEPEFNDLFQPASHHRLVTEGIEVPVPG